MKGHITFGGKEISFAEGETVLDCLLRHEQPIASSCRSGVCQSCLVQSHGKIPNQAQRGLKPSLIAQGYFLACQCPAQQGLELSLAEQLPTYESRVLSRERVAPAILRLYVERPPQLEFKAGQFLHLIRPSDGLTRSYSVASQPSDQHLEFHVEILPGGRMSTYLDETSQAALLLRGPAGDCFYLEGGADEPLLLAGTGTGLAPLYGVARAALSAGHRAPIYLFHGGRDRKALYLSAELEELGRTHPSFHYYENVLLTEGDQVDSEPRDLLMQIKHHLPALKGFRVYVCGHPDFVQKTKKQCFLAGAAMQSIHSDPFVLASS